MPVPLYTSIPPSRPGPTGDSSPSDVQKALVETWRQAGFSPVSINTAVEHERHRGLRETISSLGMQALVVERPATPAAAGDLGRLDHLCSLSQFLSAIHGMQPAGVAAIVNADIGMSPGVDAQAVATAAEATGNVIGQRLDVSGSPEGAERVSETMDVNGVDFVAFRSESVPGLNGLLPAGLRFGMPWAAVAAGAWLSSPASSCRLVAARSPCDALEPGRVHPRRPRRGEPVRRSAADHAGDARGEHVAEPVPPPFSSRLRAERAGPAGASPPPARARAGVADPQPGCRAGGPDSLPAAPGRGRGALSAATAERLRPGRGAGSNHAGS